MRILGIETSCDETAAAVVEDGRRVVSNVVVSQIDIHKEYGGVVPEVAARSHLEAMMPVVNKAVEEGGGWGAVDAIAVTNEPGLLGSLLVGTLAARTLAIIRDKPLYGVNHVKSHIFASLLDNDAEIEFPAVAMVVSGGHTQILVMRDYGDIEVVGSTRDDAAGEALDKVAKILGLSYPGGLAIAEVARRGDASAVKLPIPRVEGLDFSFSGLKTAVLRAAQSAVGKGYDFPSSEIAGLMSEEMVADFAASFERTVEEVLVGKLRKAVEEYGARTVILGGGVAANEGLREAVAGISNVRVLLPEVKYCGDNGAMVGGAGYFEILGGVQSVSPYEMRVRPTS